MKLYKLQGIVPGSVINQIPFVMEKFQINTTLRMSHFLAQCGHESGLFRVTNENLNYSEAGLISVFRKYFNTDSASKYAHHPEKIANHVYANRMGNGSELSGDGWKYKGRGYIQLTGKDNYINFSNTIGENCVVDPNLVADKYPLASAAWFFSRNGINQIADQGPAPSTIEKVTRRVNGGTNGLNERVALFNKIYIVFA